MTATDDLRGSLVLPNYAGQWEKDIITRVMRMMVGDIGLRLVFGPGEEVLLGSSYCGITMAPPRLKRLFQMLFQPSLAFGDGYVKGDWRLIEGDLYELLVLLTSRSPSKFMKMYNTLADLRTPAFLLRHLVMPVHARRNLHEHYNLDADFYHRFLGESMTYSCAFWEPGTETLEQAQLNKLNKVAQRAQVQPGDRVLDIGCGWGRLTRFLATDYGADAHGVTVTPGQFKEAQRVASELPEEVRSRLHYHLTDYREYRKGEQAIFDKVVSVGMFEHLGLGQYRHYFDTIRRYLVPGGRAVIHSIVRPKPGKTDEWIHRNIFPGGYIPAVSEMLAPAEKAGLDIETVYVHEGENYRRTLEVWRERFHRIWPEIRGGVRDDEFFRLWDFYLAGSESAFVPEVANMKVAHLVIRRPAHDR